MEYFVGAAVAAVFIGVIAAAFLLGYKIGARRAGRRATAVSGAGLACRERKDAEEMARRRREEQLMRDFEIIAGYNLSKALERKRGGAQSTDSG